MSGITNTVQGLALLATGSLGSANATISVTVPTGYRYLRVVFQGYTTGDPGVTHVKMRINAAAVNYQSRAYGMLTTTVVNVTSTDSIPVSPDSAFGAAARVFVCADISSPAAGNKQITGTFAGIEPTSPTYSSGTISSVYNSTSEVTGVSFVLTASTFTTASRIYVFGSR